MSKQSDLTVELFELLPKEFQGAFLMGARVALRAVHGDLKIKAEKFDGDYKAALLDQDHALSAWHPIDILWRFGKENT